MVQPCASKSITHLYSVRVLHILGGIKSSSAAYHTTHRMRVIWKWNAKAKNVFEYEIKREKQPIIQYYLMSTSETAGRMCLSLA